MGDPLFDSEVVRADEARETLKEFATLAICAVRAQELG
jgi:hypothetical protein